MACGSGRVGARSAAADSVSLVAAGVYACGMPSVYDLTLDDLEERLNSWGEPAYRARQVFTQLWSRGASYDQMTDISPALRERLAHELPTGVQILEERTADRGATRKALLKLGSAGHLVETVIMGYGD